jgi:hypothetical protein
MIPQLGFTEEVRLEMAWEGGKDALPGREGIPGRRAAFGRKRRQRNAESISKCHLF